MNATGKPGERTTTPIATPGGRRPLAVFTIVETDSDKALWRRVGCAFVNRDGSYNLFLDALPVNGRLHMRESDQTPLNHERTNQ